MTKLLTSSMVFPSVLVAMSLTAQASPVVTAGSVSAGAPIKVSVADAGPGTSLFGYTLSFQIVPEPGATGTVSITGATALGPMSQLFFASGSQNPPEGAVYVVTNADFAGLTVTSPIDLFSLAYSISPGATGVFDVNFFVGANAYKSVLLDGNGTAFPGVSLVAGTIAIPEPTACLGMTAALGLLCRRRR